MMMNENTSITAGRHPFSPKAGSLPILNTGLTGFECPKESDLTGGQRQVIELVLRSGFRAALERRAVEGGEPSWMIVAYFDGKQNGADSA